jgi:hypothetical protein
VGGCARASARLDDTRSQNTHSCVVRSAVNSLPFFHFAVTHFGARSYLAVVGTDGDIEEDPDSYLRVAGTGDDDDNDEFANHSMEAEEVMGFGDFPDLVSAHPRSFRRGARGGDSVRSTYGFGGLVDDEEEDEGEPSFPPEDTLNEDKPITPSSAPSSSSSSSPSKSSFPDLRQDSKTAMDFAAKRNKLLAMKIMLPGQAPPRKTSAVQEEVSEEEEHR